MNMFCKITAIPFLLGLSVPIYLICLYWSIPGGGKTPKLLILWIPCLIQTCWTVCNLLYNISMFLDYDNPFFLPLKITSMIADFFAKSFLLYYVVLRITYLPGNLVTAIAWRTFIALVFLFYSTTIFICYFVIDGISDNVYHVMSLSYYIIDGLLSVLEIMIVSFYLCTVSKVGLFPVSRFLMMFRRAKLVNHASIILIWGILITVLSAIGIGESDSGNLVLAFSNAFKYLLSCYVAKETVRIGSRTNFRDLQSLQNTNIALKGNDEKKGKGNNLKSNEKPNDRKMESELIVDYVPE